MSLLDSSVLVLVYSSTLVILLESRHKNLHNATQYLSDISSVSITYRSATPAPVRLARCPVVDQTQTKADIRGKRHTIFHRRHGCRHYETVNRRRQMQSLLSLATQLLLRVFTLISARWLTDTPGQLHRASLLQTLSTRCLFVIRASIIINHDAH